MCEILDVISSGSLLGLYYKDIVSYPIRYEQIIEMRSLDFEEFLWALGLKENVIEPLRKSFEKKKVLIILLFKDLKNILDYI